MPAFEYRVVDTSGKILKGLVEGDSSRHARQQLKSRGLTILHIAEISSLHKKESRKLHFNFLKVFVEHRKNRLSHSDITLMTRQLATLISAGLPIEEALSGLVDQAEKTTVKRTLAAVRAKVMDGYSLSSALEQFPQIFSKLYVASVTAGEHTGRLSEVLLRLADHLENQYALRQKITQALIYPCMMMIISIAIVVFLLIYVVPKIIEVFQDTNQTLPFVTQILLNISAFFQHYGIALFIIIAATFFIFNFVLKKYNLYYQYHHFLMRLPFIGYLIKISNTTKFSQTLGILVETGVPVLDSMYIAQEVVEKLPIKESLKQSAQSIKEGSSIHLAIKQTGYFNPMSVYLIANGEATGKLEEMLEKMAHYQEQELTRIINISLSLFEPILILVMGVFILFIVLAILLPIFSYNQLIG